MSKTEEQIIQALKTCQTDKACTSCSYYAPTNMKCISQLASDASSLIKRLKEEKENLIRNYANCQKEFLKEFVEKLKDHCNEIINQEWNKKASPVSWSDAYESFIDDIEILEKEMTGGEP
jgi:mannosyltransferase OCH1-like enzyme